MKAGIVFFSYRYDDSRELVLNLIYPRLQKAFGDNQIVIDEYAFDFTQTDDVPESTLREKIHNTVHDCDVVLVFIGKHWERIIFNRRHHHTDWVRFELEAAHDLRKPLLPVLLNGVKLPDPEYLPRAVQEDFFRHQPIELRTNRGYFDQDIQQLIGVVWRQAKWGRLPGKSCEAKVAQKEAAWAAPFRMVGMLWASALFVIMLLLMLLGNQADLKFNLALPELPVWSLPDITQTDLTPVLNYTCHYAPNLCQVSQTAGVALSRATNMQFAATTALSATMTLLAYLGLLIPKRFATLRLDPVSLLVIVVLFCFAFYTAGDRLFGLTLHLLIAYTVMLTAAEFEEDRFLIATGMLALLFSLLTLGIDSTIQIAPRSLQSTMFAFTAAIFTRLVRRDWLATTFIFLVVFLAMFNGLNSTLNDLQQLIRNLFAFLGI